MRKVDEYRRNAVVTVDLASKAATTFDKSRLLAWRINGSTLPIERTA